MNEKRVTFRGGGPLRRSTVGDAVPDRGHEALNDVLHWIWSWRVQLRRFRESTQEQGSGADALEQRKSFSKASFDEHLLLVAGGNLVRAIDRATERFAQTEGFAQISMAEAVGLLRNLYEHWDEQRRSFQEKDTPKRLSGKKFVDHFPDGRPWSLVYTTDDWLLGGVVPIAALTRELDAIEAEALRLEQGRNT